MRWAFLYLKTTFALTSPKSNICCYYSKYFLKQNNTLLPALDLNKSEGENRNSPCACPQVKHIENEHCKYLNILVVRNTTLICSDFPQLQVNTKKYWGRGGNRDFQKMGKISKIVSEKHSTIIRSLWAPNPSCWDSGFWGWLEDRSPSQRLLVLCWQQHLAQWDFFSYVANIVRHEALRVRLLQTI